MILCCFAGLLETINFTRTLVYRPSGRSGNKLVKLNTIQFTKYEKAWNFFLVKLKIYAYASICILYAWNKYIFYNIFLLYTNNPLEWHEIPTGVCKSYIVRIAFQWNIMTIKFVARCVVELMPEQGDILHPEGEMVMMRWNSRHIILLDHAVLDNLNICISGVINEMCISCLLESWQLGQYSDRLRAPRSGLVSSSLYGADQPLSQHTLRTGPSFPA